MDVCLQLSLRAPPPGLNISAVLYSRNGSSLASAVVFDNSGLVILSSKAPLNVEMKWEVIVQSDGQGIPDRAVLELTTVSFVSCYFHGMYTPVAQWYTIYSMLLTSHLYDLYDGTVVDLVFRYLS